MRALSMVRSVTGFLTSRTPATACYSTPAPTMHNFRQGKVHAGMHPSGHSGSTANNNERRSSMRRRHDGLQPSGQLFGSSFGSAGAAGGDDGGDAHGWRGDPHAYSDGVLLGSRTTHARA